jgi:hypothetical protein
MNLVKAIKSLQKDIQSYKVDNDKLMKDKEEQDGLNIKFLQSLDIIEKNMDKETESNKTGRHRSHDEGRKKKRRHTSPSLSKISIWEST